MGASWNRSLEQARCRYVKLLPADDLLEPKCLELQVAILASNPMVVVCSSSRSIINSEGKVVGIRRPLKTGVYSWSELRNRVVYGVTNVVGEPGGYLFRKDLLEKVSFSSEYRYYIDLEFFASILQYGDAFISETPLYQFRIHSGGASFSSWKRSVAEAISFHRKFAPNAFWFQRIWFYMKVYVLCFVRMCVIKLIALIC
jgi:hypothetical protein